MPHTVFVIALGFTALERHSLQSFFDLSRDRSTVYMPWREGSARPASMVLVDGSAAGSRRTFEQLMASNPGLLPVWVVTDLADMALAPPSVLEVLQRPINWQQLLATVDAVFHAHQDATSVDLDFDRIDDVADTAPQVIETGARALLMHPVRDTRLLVRAALSARGHGEIDDATTLAQAKSLLANQHYAVALFDINPTNEPVWDVVATVRNQMGTAFGMLDSNHWLARLAARRAGCAAVLLPPLNVAPVVAVLEGNA